MQEMMLVNKLVKPLLCSSNKLFLRVVCSPLKCRFLTWWSIRMLSLCSVRLIHATTSWSFTITGFWYWAADGNPHVLHMKSLLDAEYERCNGGKHLCEKDPFRFSVYWIACGNNEEASYRMNRAIRLYDDWGAKHKVRLLLPTTISRLSIRYSDGSIFSHLCLVGR